MSGTQWWQGGVVYQIYPRSFADASGDGVGDLPGITRRLEYLSWLGVDAIWLSPIFASPMADFGYDVSDYTDIDPVFGTLADFDDLVARAHRLGLKVLLDFVPNHTSVEHPWFEQSRYSRQSPKRDWYLWAAPAPGGGPPNNWRGISGEETEGSAWQWDEATSQYFLATFSPSQPDLNWRNPEVAEAMLGVLRFWLDRGVDGFRIDMIDWLGKDAGLRDDPPLVDDGPDFVAAAVYQLNQPETYEYIRRMRQVADEYGAVTVGEVAYSLPLEKLVSYYGDEGDLLHLPFNFRLITLPLEPESLRKFIGEYDAAVLDAGAWPNYCLGNHDNPRVSRHGERRARLATMLLLTLRGTPFIYYGDEIGMENVEVPEKRRQDPWTNPANGEGRDSARTPMQWDASANAGFCPQETEPWLPVGQSHESLNVEAQSEDPASMLSLNRALLRLRRESSALFSGGYRALDGEPEGCFAYLREGPESAYLVALNFGDGEASLELPGGAGRVAVSTFMDRRDVVEGSIDLRPGEGCVVELYEQDH